MRRIFIAFALASGILCLSGCAIPAPWPGTTETSSAIRGHVADAETKQPVGGARVQIHGRPDTATTTDATGEFHLAEVREFYLMRVVTPCPVYYFPEVREKSFLVDISHPDYEPMQLDAFLSWQYWDSPRTNVPAAEIAIRDVLLIPKPTHTVQ